MKDKAKRKKLEAAGFTVGRSQDYLETNDTEAAMIGIRVAIAQSIRARRKSAGLTQAHVGKMAATTQSRVAKVENASAEVSMDLCMRVLLVLGGNQKKILKAVAA